SSALLMIFLGDAVWEGYPGAASRVLLPMQLAFNILVPRSRGWTLVLLLGNLTLLAAPTALEAPRGDGYTVTGPAELVYGTAGDILRIEFSDAWYPAERYRQDYWCWAAESGHLLVKNPQHQPLVGRLRFAVNVRGSRNLWLKINGEDAWGGYLTESAQVNVVLNNIVLQPGTTRLDLVTDAEGKQIGEDPRVLMFRLVNLRIDLQRMLPPGATK
ncbi:MAG: hypothetical protein PSW75_08660, partial [bacterium]|nr:hypothetical protein [bacterium]